MSAAKSPPQRRESPAPLSIVVSFQGELSTILVRSTLAKWGRVLSCNPSRPGQFLVKLVTTAPDAEKKITSIRSLNEKPVTITLFQSSCFGTIFFKEFTTWSDEEIQEELGNSASLVRRMATRDGAKDKSGRLLVEFKTNELPESITLQCGVILGVRVFIPPPLRCNKCHNFNHHGDSCNNAARCGRCGSTGHKREACPAPSPCCPACKGSHEVEHPQCPAWKREREVKSLRITKGITTREARVIYNSASRKPVATARKPVRQFEPAPPPAPGAWQQPPPETAPAEWPMPGPSRKRPQAPVVAAPEATRAPSAPPAQPSALDNRLLDLFESQNRMLTQITQQNAMIISMLQTLVTKLVAAPTQPSTPERKRPRINVSPPADADPQFHTPRDEEGTKRQKRTVYNLGADSITSPLAKNYATFDFLEKGT